MVMTTIEKIKQWILEGQKKNATHLIVVCDRFDMSDYPIYVNDNQKVKDVYEEYENKEMSKVMEVYSYNIDIEKQLKERRAFHFD